MTSKSIFLSTCAILALPAMAAAQDMTGGLSLGYGMAEVSEIDEDGSVLGIGGRVDMDLDYGFEFGAFANSRAYDIDNLDQDFSVTSFGADGTFRLMNGVGFGIYAERSNLDIDGLADDFTATSLGVTGSYRQDGVDVEFFYGDTDTDPELPADYDVTDYGFIVGWAPSNNLSLGGSFMRTEVSGPVEEYDVDSFGLAGVYDFENGLSIFGGGSRASLDLDPFGFSDVDASVFGIGVAFDTSSILNVTSNVSLEVARSTLSSGPDDIDADSITISFTLPLGETATAPQSSIADAVMNPRRSAILSSF